MSSKPTVYDLIQDQRPLSDQPPPTASVDMGGQDITNVDTVDGVDISGHVAASTLVHGIANTANLLESGGSVKPTAKLQYSGALVFNNDRDIVDKSYVDGAVAGSFWSRDLINGYLYPAVLTDKVGIGKNNPGQMLDVLGNIAVSGTVDGVDLSSDVVLKSGSLTQLTTRNHSDLQNIGANDHHNQSHILSGADHTASGLTVGYVIRASGATTFAWAQLSHSDLGGISADQHHNQSHVLSGTDHTASGLTVGYVLRASGATTFAWAQLSHSDLGGIGANDHHNQSHVFSGADHTESGLTIGYVIRASGAMTFSWSQLSHSDLGGISADQHHNQSHVLSGTDHTASGLTVGYVIRASGATTFSWSQLSHSDLGGVSADQHHNQAHEINGTDHLTTGGGLAWSKIDKTGSNLTDLVTRSHTNLSDIGTNSHSAIDSHISSNHVNQFNGRTGNVSPASGDYTWSQITKTISDIADITTRSHTSLSDIGTTTHANIDIHISATTSVHGIANTGDLALKSGSISQFTTRSHTDLSDIGTNTHANIDSHISATTSIHGITNTNDLALKSGSISQFTTRSHADLQNLTSSDDHTQYILATGTRSFSGVVSGVDPTASAHLATKSYVDSKVQGLDWQQSVLSRWDASGGLPVGPSTGNRYLCKVAGNGWVLDHIYEYNGATWDNYTPNKGWATWVEDETIQYTYSGAAWVVFGSTISHHVLSELTTYDDHSQYLNTTRHDTTSRHSLGTVVPHDNHDNLSNVTANQHHNQAHVLSGTDHTASGLTTGYVIRASGATTFAWAQLSHSDLGGVSADQHHNQAHEINGTDHLTTGGGLAWSKVDKTGSNITDIATRSHTSLSDIGTNTHSTIDTHLASTSNPHSVTKAQVGLTNVTDDAQLKRSAGDFSTFTLKGTPVSGDVLLIEDSADSGNKKYITVGSISGSGEANTASNLGVTTYGLYKQKVGVDLQFKSLTASSTKITLTSNANDVGIDVAPANITHNSLGSIGANDHHNQAHIITSSDHTVTGSAANQIIGLNAANNALEYKTITGTSNRITVTHGANSITLSGPQDIHTGASPTFLTLNLTQNTNQIVLGTTNTVTITLATQTGSHTVTIPDRSFILNDIRTTTTTNLTGFLKGNGSVISAITDPLPIANGGTGQTTNTLGFNALSPLTTKGDLIVHNGTNNVRIAVGATNGYVLTVDSAQTSGIKWALPTKWYAWLSMGAAELPNTNYGRIRKTSGTNFVYYSILFDQTTAQYIYFYRPLNEGYAGGNITVKAYWKTAVAGTNAVVWAISVRSVGQGQVYDAVTTPAPATGTVTSAATGTTGQVIVATITLSSNLPTAGNLLQIKFYRDAGAGADTLGGDAELVGLKIEEA